MTGAKKIRLDELLVAQGLADSRSQAKALVLAGKVRCGTERLDKPGRSIAADTELTVVQGPRFVSRGGEKLDGFLKQFAIDVASVSIFAKLLVALSSLFFISIFPSAII